MVDPADLMAVTKLPEVPEHMGNEDGDVLMRDGFDSLAVVDPKVIDIDADDIMMPMLHTLD